ncbi:unnamed protein product [Medioppia subpectinata]|uniref:Uncharacterized protein n=1 Tax=Medioppia subpectinata TaxID=1979941 RepID=A0A7R9KZC0_9ACAR|nr:unnamed protein product [Medioppia subpectinata]CAG2112688.1 unnamed protein product [Medioppia subpectinata]
MALLNQEMYANFQYPSHCVSYEINHLYPIYEFIPIARYFMVNPLQKLQQTYNKCFEYAINELKLRDNNYNESNGRDFCSQYIDAKRRAEAEGKPGFECLNDNNIAAVVVDMYFAGLETIDWQQIMRNEVNNRLGDRAPVVTDKQHMHNVMAFIYETTRFRTAAPIGAPHLTSSDTIIGYTPFKNHAANTKFPAKQYSSNIRGIYQQIIHYFQTVTNLSLNVFLISKHIYRLVPVDVRVSENIWP